MIKLMTFSFKFKINLKNWKIIIDLSKIHKSSFLLNIIKNLKQKSIFTKK